MPELEPVVCYQSRVGPLEWIGPSTDAEIIRAGQDGKGVIVAPIAFVSEHSETLVELDIEYRKLAGENGVPDYRRAATVGAHPDFIAGLAGLVRAGAGRQDCHLRRRAHLSHKPPALRLWSTPDVGISAVPGEQSPCKPAWAITCTGFWLSTSSR